MSQPKNMTEVLSNPGFSKPYTFYWAEKNIIAGGTSPITKQQLEFLEENGIGHIISLTKNSLIEPIITGDNEYANVEESVKDYLQKFQYLHVPIEDNTKPTEKQIQLVMDLIKIALDNNKGVYVHSWTGRGRTSIMLALYFMIFWEMSGKTVDNDSGVIGFLRQLAQENVDRDRQYFFEEEVAWLNEFENSEFIKNQRIFYKEKNPKRVLVYYDDMETSASKKKKVNLENDSINDDDMEISTSKRRKFN